MLETADLFQESAPVPFSLIDEPPPTLMGNKGDPFIQSMTQAERNSYLYLRHRHGATTARRLIQFKREHPGAALPRNIRPSPAGVAAKSFSGGWFVGLTNGDRVRVVLDGTTHDLSIQEAAEFQAALARIAA